MREVIPVIPWPGIAIGLAFGGALGAAYCLWLWRSTRSLARTRASPGRVLGEAALRALLVATAVLTLGGGEWPRLVAVLLGFVLVRSAVLRRVAGALRSAAPGARRPAT